MSKKPKPLLDEFPDYWSCVHGMFLALSPEVFDLNNPRPLAIGSRETALEALSPRLAPGSIVSFLHEWCVCYMPYQQAIARGGARYTIHGEPSGEVDAEASEKARGRIERHAARTQKLLEISKAEAELKAVAYLLRTRRKSVDEIAEELSMTTVRVARCLEILESRHQRAKAIQEQVAEIVRDVVNQGQRSVIAVVGGSGAGKSAMLWGLNRQFKDSFFFGKKTVTVQQANLLFVDTLSGAAGHARTTLAEVTASAGSTVVVAGGEDTSVIERSVPEGFKVACAIHLAERGRIAVLERNGVKKDIVIPRPETAAGMTGIDARG